MHNILGKWYIHKNNNFNDFLKFTQTPWYQRKIAEHSNIDLEITKINDDNFVKTINSLFYNNKEEIEINGEYNDCDKLKKKYEITGSENESIINVDIKGTIVNWKEKIYYNEPHLIVEYIWNVKNENKYARQYFLRY